MRTIFLFVLAILWYIPSVTAQDIVKQYPLQNIELDSLTQDLYGALAFSFNAWDSSVAGASHRYFTIEDTRYHMFVYHRMDEYGETWTPDLDAVLILVNKPDRYERKFWKVSMGPIGYPTQIEYAYSTAFSAHGTVYLKLIFKQYNDLVDRGWVHFFALDGDSLQSVGQIALYERDDPSGGELDLYDGDLLPFKRSPDGVFVTLERERYSTYNIDYLLTPTKLQLIKNHEPEFHVTYEEAKAEIDNLFSHYYAGYWEDADTSAAKNRSRARHYVYEFERLIEKRHDFAPAYYNAACMHAILEEEETAVGYLKKAFELDQAYIEKAKSDPDLDSLKDLPEFQSLIK